MKNQQQKVGTDQLQEQRKKRRKSKTNSKLLIETKNKIENI